MEELLMDVIIRLRQNRLADISQDIVNIINYMAAEVKALSQTAAQDVPMDVLTERVNHLMEAYRTGDVVRLADVLEYEIADAYTYINEVKCSEQ